jgi:hypothetical protein
MNGDSSRDQCDRTVDLASNPQLELPVSPKVEIHMCLIRTKLRLNNCFATPRPKVNLSPKVLIINLLWRATSNGLLRLWATPDRVFSTIKPVIMLLFPASYL